jgi:hypothetical protein
MAEIRVLRRNRSYIFVEASPYEQVVTIGLANTPIKLPLPWTYYVFALDRSSQATRCAFIAGAPKQIKRWKRWPRLYVLPLPNVYGGFEFRYGGLCSPWQGVRGGIEGDDEEIAYRLISTFWQARFKYFEAPGKCHRQLARKAGFQLSEHKYAPIKMYEYWSKVDLERICHKRWIRSTRILKGPKRFFS